MNRTTTVIGVAGAGSMGAGIAQLAAMAGFDVVVYARRAETTDAAMRTMQDSLVKLHEKGLIAEDPSVICARITLCHDLTALSGCCLVVEAIAEQMQPKIELLRELARLLPENAVLATTTSSLSVTALGAASGIPNRFVGMHFMNPVPLMEVVELIAGEQTAPQTVAFAQEMTVALGKTFVCSQDRPGFIITRLLCVLINEAFEMVRDGVAAAEEIDTAMKLGAHHPMGPLALADMIGLDVILAASNTLAEGIDGHKYAPSKLLQEYVAKGWLGRKRGRGVYNYTPGL